MQGDRALRVRRRVPRHCAGETGQEGRIHQGEGANLVSSHQLISDRVSNRTIPSLPLTEHFPDRTGKALVAGWGAKTSERCSTDDSGPALHGLCRFPFRHANATYKVGEDIETNTSSYCTVSCYEACRPARSRRRRLRRTRSARDSIKASFFFPNRIICFTTLLFDMQRTKPRRFPPCASPCSSSPAQRKRGGRGRAVRVTPPPPPPSRSSATTLSTATTGGAGQMAAAEEGEERRKRGTTCLTTRGGGGAQRAALTSETVSVVGRWKQFQSFFVAQQAKEQQQAP